MMVLEELEKKVLQVINNNKRLQQILQDLERENKSLKEQKDQLEMSLLREHENLTKEKDKVKDSIESLLESINNIEQVGY